MRSKSSSCGVKCTVRHRSGCSVVVDDGEELHWNYWILGAKHRRHDWPSSTCAPSWVGIPKV